MRSSKIVSHKLCCNRKLWTRIKVNKRHQKKFCQQLAKICYAMPNKELYLGKNGHPSTTATNWTRTISWMLIKNFLLPQTMAPQAMAINIITGQILHPRKSNKTSKAEVVTISIWNRRLKNSSLIFKSSILCSISSPLRL